MNFKTIFYKLSLTNNALQRLKRDEICKDSTENSFNFYVKVCVSTSIDEATRFVVSQLYKNYGLKVEVVRC